MSDEIVRDFVAEELRQDKKEVPGFLKPIRSIRTLEMELLQIIGGLKSRPANGSVKIL